MESRIYTPSNDNLDSSRWHTRPFGLNVVGNFLSTIVTLSKNCTITMSQRTFRSRSDKLHWETGFFGLRKGDIEGRFVEIARAKSRVRDRVQSRIDMDGPCHRTQHRYRRCQHGRSILSTVLYNPLTDKFRGSRRTIHTVDPLVTNPGEQCHTVPSRRGANRPNAARHGLAD